MRHKKMIKLAKRYSLAYNAHMARCWADWCFAQKTQYAQDYDWEFAE